VLASQIKLVNLIQRSYQWLDDGHRLRADKGEISATVILVAIFCTLAIAVGAIIVAKVTAKANSIPTQ